MQISQDRLDARTRVTNLKIAILEAVSEIDGLTDSEMIKALSEVIADTANNQIIEATP